MADKAPEIPKGPTKPGSDGRLPFVHLHTHSHYSLLDGLSKVDEMVKLAKKYEMPALAITDHGNMYGAVEFYQYAKKVGIKPIIGVETYIANRTRFDKQPGIDNQRYHLTLLAKNFTGYQNLIKMVTAANLEGYYYKPRMDKQLLRDNHEGIIALSGCLGGEFCDALRNNDEEKAKQVAREHQEIFGKENYFLEIMHHPNIEGFNDVKAKIIKMSKELDIPLVATQDSHYLHKDDARAQDAMLSIQTNSDLTQVDRFTMSDEDYHFINTDTAYKHFAECPEAVEQTSKIADMCDVEIPLGKWYFPDLRTEDGKTFDEKLREITYAGIEKRKLDPTDKVLLDRIEYELKIIQDKGYSPYFLVVADLLRYAAESGIYTNIRGSVAGSVVTYLTGITKVHPIEYKLPFERFLNPERPSAPDIDMDYADNRRDEMLDYVRNKYGADKVAQLGTFGTMMARGAVRDVARALGHPYAIGDRISKMIPMGSQGFPMTIDHAMELMPELRDAYEKEADTKEIIDLAKKVEGCVRHVSVHAAGVVISPTPLTDFTPTQLDPKGGKVITQYDMYVIEDVGLLKYDFLGIRNLAILRDAVRIVKRTHDVDIDIEDIPLDDKKTFGMLARGETMGLFQLNGSGMTKYLKELKPTTIHDINAMVALYRPGPIEMIPEYIKRKHNPKLISYLDPRLEPILDASFGVITYQDDVMLTAIHLAGYSWLEADKLRKAMGKKIPEEMEAQKTKLLEGFEKNGLSKEKSMELWTLIEPFAAYGFNKAHAASYGRVAYQTAYMKANYPGEYMTAVLSAEAGDVEEVSAVVEECKRMQIPVLPPDINESYSDFTVIKATTGAIEGTPENVDRIRFGLYTIKNFGADIGDAIIKERTESGKFTSYSNLLERIHHKGLNKKSLEALIKTGALDAFGERGAFLANMDEALAYHKDAIAEKSQDSLFSLFGEADTKALPGLKLKPAEPAAMMEKLTWEKELLGLYVSGHPLDRYRDKFKEENSIKAAKELGNGRPAIIAGLVTEIRPIITKKGDQMAFVKIADFTDMIEVVLFPRTYAECKATLVPEACVAIRGSISNRNDEMSLIGEAIKIL
ncbi:MAG: DNA polymerase III subunit alpha [Patescibacteria group bacterium]